MREECLGLLRVERLLLLSFLAFVCCQVCPLDMALFYTSFLCTSPVHLNPTLEAGMARPCVSPDYVEPPASRLSYRLSYLLFDSTAPLLTPFCLFAWLALGVWQVIVGNPYHHCTTFVFGQSLQAKEASESTDADLSSILRACRHFLRLHSRKCNYYIAAAIVPETLEQ